ncbi:MAG TPA: ABC transporter permease [Vicinamibacterales bacterium]|nr:ABC transporter permease [Vicinamibacterales bacterium]
MRGLRYAFDEAVASLLRGWRSAALGVLTIAAGLFVLGFFLVVNTNLQRVVGRWSEAAELSVFLHEDATPEQVKALDAIVEASGLAAETRFVSKADAMKRFQDEFPDLAGAAGSLGRNPLPASLEVRLNARGQDAGDAVDRMAETLAGTPGAADVRYDRRWLNRLNAAVRFVRGLGLLVVAMLAVAAALTVANVVRLAAYARRDEIEIMQLVGAPLAYIRGPFLMEGVLQGGIGSILAILLLWLGFTVGRARVGELADATLGIGRLSFLPVELSLLLVLGGMLLGGAGAFIVTRR